MGTAPVDVRYGTSGISRLVSATALAGAIAAAFFASTGALSAFTLFSGCDASGFSDIITNPSDMYTWDIDDITYRFAPNFDATWPNPRVKQQVRLALQTWTTANNIPYGSTYSYNRANGFQNFGDIRSIALHEMGHVLGLTHPNQGAASSRNWRPSGGTYAAQADAGNEVMRSWINAGDYNHILSHDELDAFRRNYGRQLAFTEVGATATAAITLQAYTAGASNWANGGCSGVYRTGNTCEGVQSTSGGISFNDSSSNPLGLRSKGINWDYRSLSGKATSSITVRTRGTDNRTPLWVYSNEGPRRFNTFHSYGTGIIFLPAEQKDDLFHVWSSPNGGPIPAADILHVGLEQDVWDWSVISAEVKAADGTHSTPALVSFHDWNNTTVVGTPAGPSASPSDWQSGNNLTTRGTVRVTSRGIRIQNSDGTALISQLLVGRVDDLHLKLPDLNASRLQALLANQRVEQVPGFEFRILEPGEDFYLIMEGSPEDLPPDVFEDGRYLTWFRPDLLDHDLFVFARSQNEESEVGTYSLLQTEPTGGANIQQWCYTDQGEIPDGSPNGAEFPIGIEGINGVVTKAVVSTTIFHPRSADLTLVLEGPDGRQVVLSRNNGTGSNYGSDCPAQYGTIFDDDAELAIFQGDSPFTGEFRPEEQLRAFRGDSPNGVWRLRVFDLVSGESGFLGCWCLKLYTCDGECADTIDGTPKIDEVVVTPAIAGVGDAVHVKVQGSDDTDLALVSANGYPLAHMGGNMWEGDIPAEAPFGLHYVKIEAGDASGNGAEDSSGSYTSVRFVQATNRDLVDRMIPNATANFVFGASGRVVAVNGDFLDISDGGQNPLRVHAPGHTLNVGDFCLTRGILDTSASPVTLYSAASKTLSIQ